MFQAFATIATSIFLEGLFFLLIGVILSSVIDVFVSEEIIRKFIPKNKFLALLSASLLGLIFPICECGIVPVIHRLLKKGVPLYLCITLLFASPIVNIVVIFSTYIAFRGYPLIVFLRIAGGFLISILMGFIVSIFFKKEEVINLAVSNTDHISCECSHGGHHHSDIIPKTDSTNTTNKKITNLGKIISHAIVEFFDTSRYFIFGILITSTLQTIIPNQYYLQLGHNFPLSNIFMIFLPYVLSVCSNTDAFIARSFLYQFNTSSLLCFMVFGAMFDIKTTIMLKKIFKTGFIVRLLILVIIATLCYSFIVEIFLSRGM